MAPMAPLAIVGRRLNFHSTSEEPAQQRRRRPGANVGTQKCSKCHLPCHNVWTCPQDKSATTIKGGTWGNDGARTPLHPPGNGDKDQPWVEDGGPTSCVDLVDSNEEEPWAEVIGRPT